MYSNIMPLGFFIFCFIIVLRIYSKKERINDTNKIEERNGIFYEITSKDPYTGIARTYCKKGSLLAEKRYKNGKEDGITSFYYENGQIEQESYWKNGERTGLTTLYYQNSRIKEETEWKKNKKHGLSRFYNEEGDITEEFSFKKGEEIYSERLFYE